MAFPKRTEYYNKKCPECGTHYTPENQKAIARAQDSFNLLKNW